MEKSSGVKKKNYLKLCMINADRNIFIKQHVELYGEELFLDSVTKKSKKSPNKLSKIDQLKNLSSKIDIDLSFDAGNIKKKVVGWCLGGFVFVRDALGRVYPRRRFLRRR